MSIAEILIMRTVDAIFTYCQCYHCEDLLRIDSRVRLTIITHDAVLIEFNGPILQFSTDNPAEKEPVKSLGPDWLIFSKPKILLISDALLNQKIIAGIGNKYKSEIILFVKSIHSSKYLNLI